MKGYLDFSFLFWQIKKKCNIHIQNTNITTQNPSFFFYPEDTEVQSMGKQAPENTFMIREYPY